MVHKRIGGIAQHRYGLIAHDIAVEAVVDAWSTSDNGLILGMTGCGLEHEGQIVAYFPHAATRHKSDDRLVGKAKFLDELGKIRKILAGLRHFLDGGITHIGGLVVPFPIPVGLKRQDAVHVVYIAADVLDAPLFPYPHLGRNEIMHGNAQIVGIFGDLEIKRGIIHQNHRRWLPLIDGAARSTQETENLAQMAHHVGKTHVSHIAVMDNGLRSRLCRHHVAAQETELSLRVQLLERFYQVGGMQVA